MFPAQCADMNGLCGKGMAFLLLVLGMHKDVQGRAFYRLGKACQSQRKPGDVRVEQHVGKTRFV
tara:strand:- start:813 stop:1004 length:192 start_codon:yes stop_codon:yes gene_type:complete